jgi:hypothetical protein
VDPVPDPLQLALTSSAGCGRLVGIVRLRTKTTDFFLISAPVRSQLITGISLLRLARNAGSLKRYRPESEDLQLLPEQKHSLFSVQIAPCWCFQLTYFRCCHSHFDSRWHCSLSPLEQTSFPVLVFDCFYSFIKPFLLFITHSNFCRLRYAVTSSSRTVLHIFPHPNSVAFTSHRCGDSPTTTSQYFLKCDQFCRPSLRVSMVSLNLATSLGAFTA